jgi:hypothetical protein
LEIRFPVKDRVVLWLVRIGWYEQFRGELQYLPMARGWESKSVEAQQQEAGEKSNRSARRKMSTEEAVAFRERENLRLARQRVLQQLEASSNPRHRKVLEHALAALDEKLGRI